MVTFVVRGGRPAIGDELFIEDDLFRDREAENGVPMWVSFSHWVECDRDRHAIQHDRVKPDSQQLPLWDVCLFYLCQMPPEDGASRNRSTVHIPDQANQSSLQAISRRSKVGVDSGCESNL